MKMTVRFGASVRFLGALLALGLVGCDDDDDSSAADAAVAVCGDGVKQGDETCDDHNTASGDGCSATCQEEVVDPDDGVPPVDASAPADAGTPDPDGDTPDPDGDTPDPDGATPDPDSSTPDPLPLVVINEVQTHDPDDGPDWVELYNAGETPVSLEGFKLADTSDAGAAVLPAGLVIPAQGYVVLERDTHFPFGLGSPDQVVLSTADDRTVDSVAWEDGQIPDRFTYGRMPNGQGPFRTLRLATPGAANQSPDPYCGDRIVDDGETCDDGNQVDGDGCDSSCIAEVAEVVVKINEVVAADADGGPDWVELFNPGAAAVSLEGWTLKDEDDGEGHEVILGEVSVPAGGFTVLIKEVDFPFGLGAADQVRLFDEVGALVDIVGWEDGEAAAGSSFGRTPDGSGEARTLTPPTQGRSNVN